MVKIKIRIAKIKNSQSFLLESELIWQMKRIWNIMEKGCVTYLETSSGVRKKVQYFYLYANSKNWRQSGIFSNLGFLQKYFFDYNSFLVAVYLDYEELLLSLLVK